MNRFVEQTIEKTNMIFDSPPIHKSKKFMAKIEHMERKRCFDPLFATLFFRVKSDRILW